VISPEDWSDAEAALAVLYRRAERRAISTVDGHRRRGRAQRGWSRLLRTIAGGLVVAGILLPVVAVVRSDGAAARWCVPLFAAALVVLAVERVCGLSAGWKRELANARRAHHRLEVFQDDWTAACAPGALDGALDDRLAVLRGFSADLRAFEDRDTPARVKTPAKPRVEPEPAS
jgi:hypothetical protein